MCDPITAIEDVALTASGNAWAIPLANAGTAAVEGKGLKGAALAGGEAFLGQEIGGAFGIGSGNSAVNDALGITWDNPSSLGLPDIGSGINSAFKGVGDALGFNSSGTASSVAGNVTGTGQPVNASGQTLSGTNPVASSATPSSGGLVGASGASDLFKQQTQSELDNGILGGGSSSPNLGSLSSENAGTYLSGNTTGAASNSAIGAAAADHIGSTAPQTFWQKAGDVAMKGALPAAGLAYSAIKGPSQLPADAKNLSSGGAVTAPLLALEQSNANEAQTGQLSPSQQASVTQMVQHAQNQLLQQLASAGVSDPTHDSRYISGMQEIQQQAMALQQSYIQQALTNATNTAGAAGANISAVANEQIQLDKDYQDALAAAFAALGGTVGGGAGVRA